MLFSKAVKVLMMPCLIWHVIQNSRIFRKQILPFKKENLCLKASGSDLNHNHNDHTGICSQIKMKYLMPTVYFLAELKCKDVFNSLMEISTLDGSGQQPPLCLPLKKNVLVVFKCSTFTSCIHSAYQVAYWCCMWGTFSGWRAKKLNLNVFFVFFWVNAKRSSWGWLNFQMQLL